MKVNAILLAGAAMIACTGVQAQSLTGTTVSVAALYPDQNTVYEDAGSATVSSGIEYKEGFLPDYNSSFSIDFTSNQVDISLNGDSTTFDPATFNGFRIIFQNPLKSVTLDPVSGFVPTAISYSGNTLFLNYAGQEASGDSIFNIATGNSGVPEPATWAMMLLGFGMIGAGLRYRRKSTAVRFA